VTTQLLVTSTPAEALLAAAAAQAGLLDPPDRLVPVSPADDPDAVAARVGHDVELVVGTSTLAAGRALSRQGPAGHPRGPPLGRARPFIWRSPAGVNQDN
jgi:hypothetical protein